MLTRNRAAPIPNLPEVEEDTPLVGENTPGHVSTTRMLQFDDNGIETVVQDWPGCTPDSVISLLRNLHEDQMGDNTRKCFYLTYPSWADMNSKQQANSLTFFHKLSIPVKTVIINAARKHSVEVPTSSTNESSSTTKAASVTKDDLARIIELLLWPAAQSHISNALGSMSRRDLDARKSTQSTTLSGIGSLADAAEAWRHLAVIFMDYDEFKPQNRLIKHEFVNNQSVPINPYVPADADLTCVVARCHDLNPSNLSRKDIVRDDVWLKTQVLSLRTWISAILADFNRSGEQSDRSEADLIWLSPEEQERWVWHCVNKSRRYPGVMSYAYGVLERGVLESLGRDMGKSGRDSSLDGKNVGSAAIAESERLKKRQKKKHVSANPIPLSSNVRAESIANSLDYSVNIQFQFEIIKLKISAADTEEEKRAAKQELLSLQTKLCQATSHHSGNNSILTTPTTSSGEVLSADVYGAEQDDEFYLY